MREPISTDEEYRFLLSIRRKQTKYLSPKQLEWERKAQRRVLQKIVVKTRSRP